MSNSSKIYRPATKEDLTPGATIYVYTGFGKGYYPQEYTQFREYIQTKLNEGLLFIREVNEK